jgi:hypothetical protein
VATKFIGKDSIEEKYNVNLTKKIAQKMEKVANLSRL